MCEAFGTRVIKLIQNHYGNTKCEKDAAQVAQEAHLLPGIKFNRWWCMPAGVLVQFCVGSVYSWSVFNKPIDILIDGHVTNRAPLTFTLAIALLGLSAAVMGPWLERRGPRQAALLGTLLFFIGNMLTALALYLKVMWLVWIGYGVVGGCGIGLCYISPVSALQKWFPDHRGLASGVAVSGFGAGSIVMAKVQVEMLDWVGLPSTFLILGFIYLVVMGVAGMVLRTPPPGFSPSSMESKEEVKEEDEMSLLESLKSLDFRLLYVAFLANIIFGLVLISRFSNIVTDIFHKDADTAATVVSINGGFNLGARLVVSLTSDYLGRKNCYIILLTTQLIILATFSTLTTSQSYYSFLSAMWILTACYGAGFSVIPAFLADKFGPKNVGACHGVLLTAWSMAAVVGGVVFTLIFNHYSSQDNIEDPFPYNINTWWLCGVVFLGWLALLFVKPTKKDVQVWKGVTCRK